MRAPFTPEQFIANFREYNLGIWPAQIFAYLVGMILIALVLRPSRRNDQLIALGLALIWLWNGAVFHLGYSVRINPTSFVAGPLFVLEALLLVYVGLARRDLSFAFDGGLLSWVGALAIFYALVAYPVIGALVGHGYPSSPLFGVAPCPTTIFTFGLLLWSRPGLPRYLLIVPFLWALLGTNVALPPFGIREDFGLLASALVATALLAWRRSPRRDAQLA